MVSRPVQDSDPLRRGRLDRGHQYPPGPTTPVILRYFFLNTGWLAKLLDVGKRVVAVDNCYLDYSTTCIKCLRSWRWRYLPSPSPLYLSLPLWPVGVQFVEKRREKTAT
jgi:hypothetical protein